MSPGRRSRTPPRKLSQEKAVLVPSNCGRVHQVGIASWGRRSSIRRARVFASRVLKFARTACAFFTAARGVSPTNWKHIFATCLTKASRSFVDDSSVLVLVIAVLGRLSPSLARRPPKTIELFFRSGKSRSRTCRNPMAMACRQSAPARLHVPNLFDAREFSINGFHAFGFTLVSSRSWRSSRRFFCFVAAFGGIWVFLAASSRISLQTLAHCSRARTLKAPHDG